MGQTLTNGIYLPDEGEVRCYDGLASNWTTLDSVVGGYRAHVANENIHITSEERSKWDTGVTQAYVLRYASVSLTALGTVAFSALDNTDNVKIGDKVLDSEGKLFALTAVDTANSTATLSALLIDLSKDSDLSNYYTKGETDTLLSGKANDSGVMHLTGNESAAGNKNFEGLLTTIPNSTLWPTTTNTTADITSLGGSSIHIEYKSAGRLTDLSGGAWTVVELGDGCFFFRINNGTDIRFKHFPTNTVNRIPVVSGANRFINDVNPNQDNTYNIGSSSLRWKSINSINPGALSLPNISAGLDISSYFDLSLYTGQVYTPTVNGWISLSITSPNRGSILYEYGNVSQTAYGVTDPGDASKYRVSILIPCIANQAVTIYIRASGGSFNFAKFYPNLGNV